jgi:hypothetical protein
MKTRNILKNFRKQEGSHKGDVYQDFAARYETANLGSEEFNNLLRLYKLEAFSHHAYPNQNFEQPLCREEHYTYHNFKHTVQMTLNCFEGCLYEKIHSSTIRAVLAAALFHDVKHTHGRCSDDVNIERAIKTLKEANEVISEPLTESDLKLAIRCIRATKYPYVREGRISTKIEDIPLKIIRDADLMTAYSYKNSLDLYIGLFNEICISRDLTEKEFTEGQFEFLSKVKWNTQWAKKKAFVMNFVQVNKDLKEFLLNSEFFKKE